MSLLLEQVKPEEQDQVVAFLREIFHAPADAPFLENDHVRWRLFQPRPDWNGSRSYVFRDEGRIVAHGCAVPATYVRPSGDTFKTVFVIDWAASSSYPGFGLSLLKEMAALADMRLGYGGSPDARAVVNKAHSTKRRTPAYERANGEMAGFDRALRPLSFLQDKSIPAWRAWARAGRAIYRNVRRPLMSSGPWKVHPVERFDASFPATPARSESGLLLPFRSKELLNYMLDCPSVRFKGFLLEKGGTLAGHLLLAGRGQEVRLADLVIDSDRVDDWVACYRLAATTARREYRSGGRLRVDAALSSQREALRRVGFSEEGRVTIFSYDPRSLLADGEVPMLNMMDSDAAYLF